jgi:hypothetical protein
MENLKTLGSKSSMHNERPWTKSSPTPTDNLRNNASPWTKSPPPSMPILMQGSMTSMQSLNNFFNNVIAQSRVHQDLHAPTMGVNMSAIDNINLKANHILIAYVRGRNLPHARMRATYTLRARVIHHMS